MKRNVTFFAWAFASLGSLFVPGCSSDDSTSATPDGGVAPGSGSDAAVAHDSAATVDGSIGAGDDDSSAPDDAGQTAPDAAVTPDSSVLPSLCSGATASTSTPASNLPAVPAVKLPDGFAIETLASVSGARELVALPNGDLLVATQGTKIYLVPNAEADGNAGAAVEFAAISDSPVSGIAFDAASCTIYASGNTGIFTMSYKDAQQKAAQQATKIASVRTGSVAPNSDGDVHKTTSLAVGGGMLYAGVGSSCNSCVETDGTRATVQGMKLDGTQMATRAKRFRNAIAMATNPASSTVWAGGAGQDNVTAGHPYEFFDAVTLQTGTADYGWPDCEENHTAYKSGANCAAQAVPRIEFPAYSTLIGATFYPQGQTGTHAFPAQYRGGLFITAHGSWHKTGNAYAAAPRVAFVAMNGDDPKVAVDWNDPTKQWTDFVGGYQLADGNTRIGRPTGIAVGSQGSLFVADDQKGVVYRIRPK